MSKYSVNLDDVRAAKPRVNRVTSFFSVLSFQDNQTGEKS